MMFTLPYFILYVFNNYNDIFIYNYLKIPIKYLSRFADHNIKMYIKFCKTRHHVSCEFHHIFYYHIFYLWSVFLFINIREFHHIFDIYISLDISHSDDSHELLNCG